MSADPAGRQRAGHGPSGPGATRVLGFRVVDWKWKMGRWSDSLESTIAT